MPYCPNCGKEIEEGAKFCGSCSHQLVGKEQKVETGRAEDREERKEERKVETPTRPAAERVDAISSLRVGVNIISVKPAVLLPALAGAVVSAVLSFIAYWFFPSFGIFYINPAWVVLTLVGGIISYIMTFASLDMSRDAYLDRELNLEKSVGYVLKRILAFIVASIVGAILAITIILIPVVILMFIIMVVDEVGLTAALSQAFTFLRTRLGDIIILIVIGIVGSFILGLIPFVGSILVAAFNVLIALAYIDVYFHYKEA